MEAQHFWAFFVIALIAGGAIALAINNAGITGYQIGGIWKQIFGPQQPSAPPTYGDRCANLICPIDGLECGPWKEDQCVCMGTGGRPITPLTNCVPPRVCHYDPGKEKCIGTCPNGQVCEQYTIADGEERIGCRCVPPPTCHYDPEKGRCIGACPTDQVCELYERDGAISCKCVTPTCHYEPDKQKCIGTCPPGQVCEQYMQDGAIGCRCVTPTPTCEHCKCVDKAILARLFGTYENCLKYLSPANCAEIFAAGEFQPF